MVNFTKNLVIPREIFKEKGGVVILDWRVFEKMRREMEELKREIKRQKELEEVKKNN
jgi:AmiR/NasT family two-component response regulator